MKTGARGAFLQAEGALGKGDLEAAARAFRGYFAERVVRHETACGVDARVAILAATAAFLRGDSAELDGVRAIVTGDAGARDRDSEWALYWVGQLRAAFAGEVALVLERAHRAPPGLKEMAPLVVLVAAERAILRITPEEIAKARAVFARATLPPELHARLAVVAAATALRTGERASAVAELRTLAADGLPLHRCLAALAEADHDAAASLVSALASDDQRTAFAFAAALTAGADASVASRALAVLGPLVEPGAPRTRLIVAVARALACDGQAADALALLEAELARSEDAGLRRALSSEMGFAALVARDGPAARAALAELAEPEPMARALRVLLAAQAESSDALRRALDDAGELPALLSAAIAAPVLVAVARMATDSAPLRVPPWLEKEPADAEALYAWAAVRLRRGAAAEALGAFERALSQDPRLAAAGDAPDVARLAVAKSRLGSGHAAHVLALCDAVTSPRLAGGAALLRAMAIVRRATREGESLSAVTERLARTPEHAAAAAVCLELERSRARALIAAGRLAEARDALDAMPRDPDVAYLRATLAILEGETDAGLEAEVASAAADEPSHAGLAALLTELRGLSSALAVRRAAIEQLRRGGGVAKVTPALAVELRFALAVGALPAASVRAPSLFSPETLPARVDVLIARAARCDGSAESLARLESALAVGDLVAAQAAELELIDAIAIGRAT